MRITLATLSALTLTFAAAPAFAQDEAAQDNSPITISGGATVVSDYRFRGVSLSGEDATVQGTATITHESGFYIGAWGSGLASGTPFGGSEIDIYAGWGGDVAGLTLDVNATQYTYPDQDGTTPVDYIEFLASVAKDVGPVNAKIGVGFVPKQSGYGDASAFYLYNDYALGIPSTPFTLKAHVGYNKSDFNFDNEVIDYSVGAEATYKALTFGVSYVNTNVQSQFVSPRITLITKDEVGADGAVLFTLGASF